jgi:hypothetical protein
MERQSMFEKMKRRIQDRLLTYASRLRFPKLLALAAAVFVADLIFPDVIPFADEILLGLITLLLVMLRKRNGKTGRETD